MRSSFALRMRDELLSEPRAEMGLRLTALFLLATFPRFYAWHPSSVLLGLLAVLMLMSARLLRSRWAWLFLGAVLAYGLWARWPVTENNRYLDAYWLLACALALGTADTEEVLARNGRLLIGLTFTLAAGQKVLRGEYLDGSFMHGMALWDERFRTVATLAGGLDLKDLYANHQLRTALSLFPGGVEGVTLVTSDRLRLAAMALGYWVLCLEGSIGLSFLLPGPGWFTERRDYLLMLFILPTYLLAQVAQFGMILAIMGYAQCPLSRPRRRLAYLLSFALLCFADQISPFLVRLLLRSAA